ncbi:MAG TPA: DinB family protein [Candidatus Aquilonibacter sp.]|jgi:uncharacterized damage-inducible protein DinB|nr:DinB family protein [Candidatus Aquilonibacter sp.]
MSFAKRLLLSDIGYSAWANQRLLYGCSAFTIEELNRDLHISHSGILATLSHIYDGERVWLHCLRTTADLGTWQLPQGPAPQYSLDDIKQSWPEIWEGFSRWLEDLPESGLSVELTIRFADEVEANLARWKILRHVLAHSTFHRGQIVGMFRILHRKPPAINPMDYFLEK